jgi:23S rRNA-/tRNA-specific pseudouridylate synthase/SAM-dependent methyltransferase
VLVVDKPPGLLSSTAPGEDRPSVFGLVKEYARSRGGYGARAWIIHRLDRDASGLLVFAKTDKAYEWLKEDFRAKRVHRLYLAVVEGEITGAAPPEPSKDSGDKAERPTKHKLRLPPQLPSGTIQSFLREGPNRLMESIPTDAFRGQRRSAGPKDSSGPQDRDEHEEHGPKLAVTHWRALAAGHDRTLLQVRLETGRKNQIRVHMKEWKHPIIGDESYGARTNPIGRLALHATELGFTHPSTGQSVRFSSPAPVSFYKAVGATPPPAPPVQQQESIAAPVPVLPEHAGAPGRHATSSPQAAKRLDTSWDHVADWYDDMIGQGRSDHFERVILPGALHLLAPRAGMRVLDLACGQGALCERLVPMGVRVVGIDASEQLVQAARRRCGEMSGGGGGASSGGEARLEVGDARDLDKPEFRDRLDLRDLDAVACVMALMNIDTLEPVLRGVAASLKDGGSFVAVMIHPAFRAPSKLPGAGKAPPSAAKAPMAPPTAAPSALLLLSVPPASANTAASTPTSPPAPPPS